MADCHPILFLRMMERVRAGAKLVVVDPRFTRTAAVEWATDGIRVNSVHPGGIRTRITENARIGSGVKAGVHIRSAEPWHGADVGQEGADARQGDRPSPRAGLCQGARLPGVSMSG